MIRVLWAFIVVLLALDETRALAQAPEPRRTVLIADLDGDSKVDSAVVTFAQRSNGELDYFRVFVGRDSLVKWGEWLHGTAFVADIDTSDAQLEIAIPEYGPSGDDVVTFVRYSSAGLKVLGVVPGRVEQVLALDGSGVIRTECRGQSLHTWFYSCEFRLSQAAGEITEVPQDFKVMNWPVRLLRDLPVLHSPEQPKVIATIRRGSQATIEVTDDEEWFRIRSQAGVVGWFHLVDRGIRIGSTSVAAHEVLDGHSYAD